MSRFLVRPIDAALELVLSRGQRISLGRHILNRARGEGNGDPETNGEYNLLRLVKAHWEQQHISPRIFDVGANMGDWSLEALRGLPDTTKLFAFEPTSETYDALRSRLSAIPADVTLHEYALGDAEAVARLFVDPNSRRAGTNSLHKRRAEVHFNLHQIEQGDVRVRTGDIAAAEAGIDHISFLKIDTEGHEIAVLRGFAGMLTRQSIDFIQFEYGSAWADSRTLLVDAFDLLKPAGYMVGKIHPKGVAFFPSYDQREENFGFCNFVAVRPTLAPILPAVDA